MQDIETSLTGMTLAICSNLTLKSVRNAVACSVLSGRMLRHDNVCWASFCSRHRTICLAQSWLRKPCYDIARCMPLPFCLDSSSHMTSITSIYSVETALFLTAYEFHRWMCIVDIKLIYSAMHLTGSTVFLFFIPSSLTIHRCLQSSDLFSSFDLQALMKLYRRYILGDNLRAKPLMRCW